MLFYNIYPRANNVKTDRSYFMSKSIYIKKHAYTIFTQWKFGQGVVVSVLQVMVVK